MLDAAIVDAANREESQHIQLSQDSGCDEMQGLHDVVYREEAELFADTEWHQIKQYEVPNNVLTSSLETAKADAQGQLGASVNRNVALDDCRQSVVDTFCASTAGLMLLIGAGGTGKSEILFKIKEKLGQSPRRGKQLHSLTAPRFTAPSMFP